MAVTEPAPSIRHCRACGEGGLVFRYRIGAFPILLCPRCGSLTTNHRMTASAAADWYDSDYYRGGDYADYESSEQLLKRNFRRFVRRMRAVHTGTRLLEVGCSYGYFLDVARDTWDVEGIDVSETARVAAGRLVDRVVCGDLLTENITPGRYDWIVAWDTIEHLDDPRAFVRRFAELLKPGGYVALTTGDVSSFVARTMGKQWRLLTPPSHLTFFSRPGMKSMLDAAGFDQIAFRTAGYDRALDFALYRLLSDQAYRSIMKGFPGLQRWLKQSGFYLNLYDIMFVTARRVPEPRQ
jgi:SAM-dependent methyltransferase